MDKASFGIAGILRLSVVAAVTAGAVLAAPITYTITTIASGTFAGTPFSNAAATVTSFADTSQVFVAGGVSPDLNYEVIGAISFITIQGFAPATFTDLMYWYDPNGAGDIIFGDAATGTNVLGFTDLFVGLETYNLQSSFGPVFSPFDFVTSVFNGFQNIPTNLGLVSLVASNDTFIATAASPEPFSFLLAGLGLLGVCTWRRHPAR